MKRNWLSFLVVTFLLSSADAEGKSASSSAARDKAKSFSFEDYLIKGQYDFSLSSDVTVKEDQVLEALLKIRKDFRDRIQESYEKF